MPKISELLAAGPTYSFEFFPPKSDEGERILRDTLNRLEPLQPSFVSVTYGAGGSTRDRTRRIVVDILQRTTMTPMAHLTAFGHTRAELSEILTRYRDAGIENILALRGDPPADDPDAQVGELAYATELVDLVQEVGDGQFAVGVAAHPELHPLSPNEAEDRKYLARKLALADFGVTQFFFEAHHYERMVEAVSNHGVDTPIIPGIMPVTNLKQITRFAELSGADFPTWLADRLEGQDPETVKAIGVEVATELCQELLELGVPGLHFYTLNRSPATVQIFRNLGLADAPR